MQHARGLLSALVARLGADGPCRDDDQAVDALLRLRLRTQQLPMFNESLACLVQRAPRFFRQVLLRNGGACVHTLLRTMPILVTCRT
jgi:hypothetical protein